MPKQDEGAPSAPSDEPSSRSHDGDWRPIPDTVLVVFLAGLAVALVLGYLFLNKMVDISRQDDCILAHRANCAATGSPPDR